MGIYIFPIFLFGSAVTGIVFLGVQQARDWAKDEAERSRKADGDFQTSANREPATNMKAPIN